MAESQYIFLSSTVASPISVNSGQKQPQIVDGFIVGGSGGVTSAAGNRQNGNPANRNDSGRRDTSQERVLTNQGMSTAASVLETTPKNNGEVLQSPGPGVKVAGGVCIIHREEIVISISRNIEKWTFKIMCEVC